MKHSTLYETHIKTKNLSKAIAFYQSLQLELAFTIPERKVAFFWLGDSLKKEQMLGIWEVTEENFQPSHFAFGVTLDNLLDVPQFLGKQNITVRPAFDLDSSEPIVHPWMPSASYYFYDEDGNSLEYIAVLEQKPKPELPAMHLSKWVKIANEGEQSCLML